MEPSLLDVLTTDVLVVGGGAGGTAAAIQAARAGANTILVSDGPWLGGMLTSAGVAAPDGNELRPWQTGLWGAFLRELQQRQPEGLNHGWVSFFTYDPSLGAKIFADWVHALPNLKWITGQTPQVLLCQGNRVTGVEFDSLVVSAKVTLDATELGDLLAFGDIPHRWGWEFQAEFGEPSAPVAANTLTQTYPVQAPTWVVVLEDGGEGATLPKIPRTPTWDSEFNQRVFAKAWAKHGAEQFLGYGQLPGRRFMINWPIFGNDYGEQANRLLSSPEQRQQFLQEARWHSQNFARYIQKQLGRRYGLANIFPKSTGLGGGGFALHPYYRESRRLQGLTTVREQDLLPRAGGQVAPLSVDEQGQVTAIAVGNYVLDHHYPSGDIPLQPKSRIWGGNRTGTPFTIPYSALVPQAVDGFLVCEKNISVTHMANGATRLQPLVLGIGQAAGMAAALSVRQNCQPRQLNVRQLQLALLSDPIAPAVVIPLYNLPPEHPEWRRWQLHYLEHPDQYPLNGECPARLQPAQINPAWSQPLQTWQGQLICRDNQTYQLQLELGQTYGVITLEPYVHQQLQAVASRKNSGHNPEQPLQTVSLEAWFNPAGGWLLVHSLT
jgi:FAD dependent oxidoreductase